VARIAKHAGDIDELLAAEAAGTAADEPEEDEHALQVGSRQRRIDSVRLHRCLCLLTHAAPVLLTPRFNLDAMTQLRAHVLACFHKISSLPAYVAAEAMRQDELAAAATTAALSAEEKQALNLRLTSHNNRKIEQMAARINPPVATPRVASGVAALAVEADARAQKHPTKSLLHSQLQVMDALSASAVAAYRAKQQKQPHEAFGAVQVEGGDENSDEEGASAHPRLSSRSFLTPRTPSTALVPRPGSSTMALFQPQAGALMTSPQPLAAPGAFDAGQLRLQAPADQILLLGCFDLPLRKVANAPDGKLHAAVRLRPVEDVAQPETPLKATPRPSSGSGLTPSRPPVAHYRPDLSTQLHSSSPRTFLIPSSMPSTARPLTAPGQPRAQAGVPQLTLSTSTSPDSSPASSKRAPKALRSVLAQEARQATDECVRSTRVEIEAIFTPALDAFDA